MPHHSDTVSEPLHQVFLLPGQIHIAATPTLVTTVLGSCIAVCLWDAALRAGGMNHFVLPDRADGGGDPRYGDVAVDSLVRGLLALGCSLRTLQAKVFGGAAVLSVSGASGTIGERNLDTALNRLHRHGIPVVARRTGGFSGFLIRLNTETGQVSLRRVPNGIEIKPRRMMHPRQGA